MLKVVHPIGRFGMAIACVALAVAFALAASVSCVVGYAFADSVGDARGEANDAILSSVNDVIDLSACKVALSGQAVDYVYNGSAQTPAVTVFDADGNTVDSANYQVSYSDNTNAGAATVTVSGVAGKSSGSATCTFTINPRPIEVAWEGDTFTYDGTTHEVKATITNKLDGDYLELNVVNNSDSAVGNYLAEVYGIYGNNNYTMAGASGTSHEWLISYLQTDEDATASGNTYNQSGWFIGDAKLVAPSGFSISADGQTWGSVLPVTAEGENSVTYQLREDATGYITDTRSKTVKLDTINPAIKGVDTEAAATSATITINCAAGTSGLAGYETLLLPEGATAAFDGNVLTVSGLSAATEYSFIVLAVDESGRSASYEVAFTTAEDSGDTDNPATPSSSSKTSMPATGDSVSLIAPVVAAAISALLIVLAIMMRRLRQ